MRQSSGTENGPRHYFRELDGVRAIAALMVLVFHIQQNFHPVSFLMIGQTGVDLFFVLSGFLITNILLQAEYRDWGEVRDFYIKRTLRIFPVYYAYLVFSSLVLGIASLCYWVYLQNIFESLHLPLHGPEHFWSLGVEEQFYLVWPFLILFWPRRWLEKTMWGVVLFAIALRIALMPTSIGVFTFTPTRLDGLAGGGLLAFYYVRGGLSRYRGKLVWIGVAAAVSLIIEAASRGGVALRWAAVLESSSAGAFYVALIGLIITTGDGPTHRMLRSGPLRATGRISYGLYVYHPMVFLLLMSPLRATPVWLHIGISVAVSYLVAYLSFNFFEKRFIDLKGRLVKERVVSRYDSPAEKLERIQASLPGSGRR